MMTTSMQGKTQQAGQESTDHATVMSNGSPPATNAALATRGLSGASGPGPGAALGADGLPGDVTGPTAATRAALVTGDLTGVPGTRPGAARGAAVRSGLGGDPGHEDIHDDHMMESSTSI